MNINKITLFIIAFFLVSTSCNNASSSVGSEVDSISDLEKFKIEQLKIANDNQNLVLRENLFGELSFDYVPDLNEYLIAEKLMYFNIEVSKNEGFDEQGATIYYSGWKGQPIFTLTPNIDNNSVKFFAIQSEGIVDQYGVSIKMDYKQLMYLRPNLKLSRAIDGTPLFKEDNSYIMYEMHSEIQQKENYTEEEMLLWNVRSIIRQSFLEMELNN